MEVFVDVFQKFVREFQHFNAPDPVNFWMMEWMNEWMSEWMSEWMK